MRKGFTLAELLITIGIVVVFSMVAMASFVGRRNRSQLTTTMSAAAGMVREAQSRSASQSLDSAWGVRFSNTTPAFFALYYGTYSTSTVASYYPLPSWVAYDTSVIAAGRYAEANFSQISGLASGSSTVKIYLVQDPGVSSTLSIASSGAASY